MLYAIAWDLWAGRTTKLLQQDLKAIYQASTEENALKSLDIFCDQWNHQYPKIGESWRANWENIRTIFSYPAEIRHAIYTTNAIESLNSVIRHSTKKRKIFSSDDSVKKVIYFSNIKCCEEMDDANSKLAFSNELVYDSVRWSIKRSFIKNGTYTK